MRKRLKSVRIAVGGLILLSFVGLFGFKLFEGQRVDTLWQIVLVAIVFASGYAVFGEEFGKGIEQAKEVASEGDGGSDTPTNKGGGGTDGQNEASVPAVSTDDEETSP
jgi:hypothetical protein